MSRSWVDVPIHDRYGGPLPSLSVVNLVENVAEKIARLTRLPGSSWNFDGDPIGIVMVRR